MTGLGFEELILKAQAGDSGAKEELIVNNMRLVYSLANRYKSSSIDYEDIVQQGSIGLINAIMRFDLKKGVMFSTYAVPLILGEIKKIVRENSILKIGRVTREMSARLNKRIEEMQTELGRSPTISEISASLDISPEKTVFLLNSSNQVQSMDEAPDDHEDAYNKIQSDEDTEGSAVTNVLLDDIAASIDERQRKILYLRYYQDKTQSEVAQILGISQVQVSRIEKQLLLKLRKLLAG